MWYAGTSPDGFLRFQDDGVSWQSVDGFNLHPERAKWPGLEVCKWHRLMAQPYLRSTSTPFDKNHLYAGMSSGRVFESPDTGKTWKPLNQDCAADFLPDPNAQ